MFTFSLDVIYPLIKKSLSLKHLEGFGMGRCACKYLSPFPWSGLVKKLQPNNKFQPINEDFNQLPMLSMEGGELHRTMPICRCLKKQLITCKIANRNKKRNKQRFNKQTKKGSKNFVVGCLRDGMGWQELILSKVARWLNDQLHAISKWPNGHNFHLKV